MPEPLVSSTVRDIRISNHPLLRRDLTILRDADTPSHEFRRVLRRVASLLAFEASGDLAVRDITVRTPLEATAGHILSHPIVLVPVLRAGLGMLDPFLDVLPEAAVGHVGLYRNEATLEPVEYYGRYPNELAERVVLVLDPMLATGGSADAAVTLLKRRGASRIRLVCIVAAPQGVERMRMAHPDVPIYAAALDRGLNERGYIIPGLGDAGDRQFGTD